MMTSDLPLATLSSFRSAPEVPFLIMPPASARVVVGSINRGVTDFIDLTAEPVVPFKDEQAWPSSGEGDGDTPSLQSLTCSLFGLAVHWRYFMGRQMHIDCPSIVLPRGGCGGRVSVLPGSGASTNGEGSDILSALPELSSAGSGLLASGMCS